jgi:hypothetical protein
MRNAGLLVLASLLLSARPAAAQEVGIDKRPVFRERWVVSMWMGAPAGAGYSVSRRFDGDWRLKAAVGTPVMITGVGGAVDLVRGVRLGPATVWLGATVAGFASDMCSWGGCGEPVAYVGAGPQVGVSFSRDFIRRSRLVADLGLGVAVTLDRTDNLAPLQPLGGLHVGIGW